MKAITNLLDVPLVGCASHRFNLAVEEYLSSNFSDKIKKVYGLMKKTNTLKSCAKLRSKTPLTPIIYHKKMGWQV
jgi:hypothetical protein